jgi:hypothetical protein
MIFLGEREESFIGLGLSLSSFLRRLEESCRGAWMIAYAEGMGG